MTEAWNRVAMSAAPVHEPSSSLAAFAQGLRAASRSIFLFVVFVGAVLFGG